MIVFAKKPHREDDCIFTNAKILIGIFGGNTYAITRMAAEIFLVWAES
jgi:hypothetical protein